MNIARLVTTYNFEINIETLPNDLKCVKCKSLLKDACQVPCGYRFCRAYIDDMIANRNDFCPGDLGECRESNLSHYITSHTANNIISKLVVRCPNTGCTHDCSLGNMADHMQECSRKSVNCPFHDLGCQQDKIASEEMNEHFKNNKISHSEILIRMIADITNEMTVLRRNEETNRREIDMLKHKLVLKDEEIISILDQMEHVKNENKSMKKEKANLDDHVRILSEKIEQEINERSENEERNFTAVIEHVDSEIAAITAAIGSNKDELDMGMRSVKDDIQAINQHNKSIKDHIDSCQIQMQSIQALVGQVDARCEMVIDENIQRSFWKWGDRTSEYFTGTLRPYKYRLITLSNGTIRGELRVGLGVYPTPSDEELTWPLRATVAITVADKIKREACMSIALHCKIGRPPIDRGTIGKFFNFPCPSLVGAWLDLKRGVNVSCQIVPNYT